ncbi:MAG: xanthine dehydrogenase molybdopterin binding subunit [Alkalilacustris sp.]
MAQDQSPPHDSARLHVTGAARYVDDIPTPAGTLHLVFGLSPAAHGQIAYMDLDGVRASDGVAGVWSAADFDPMPDVSPAAHDEPLLAAGTVHYAGQPLFLVAADTHLAARRAARRARIRIAEAPAVLTIDEALAAQSRFEDTPKVWSCGDAAKAIAAAPHVIEGTMEIGGQEHFYLEGQASLALPQEDGDMVVIASSQHPTEIQHKVAEALGRPMSAVRVEVRRMGGGFGGKESQGNPLAVACAMIADRTGRPVRMRYDRDDDFLITGKRHDFRIRYRAGVDDEGRVMGAEVQHFARCGWSMDLSLPVCDRAMLHATNAYRIPAFRIESHRLRTHTQSNTAFRGFGGPQGILGAERMMDHIAQALGRDPVAVRKTNFYQPPSAPAKLRRTYYGMEVQDFILHELVDRLCQTSNFAARRVEIDAWNRSSPILKRGLALAPVQFGISFTLTHLNQAGALVHVYQDGSIVLNHGGTEMGQGLFQKVAQVAADAFGLPVHAVKITATDTSKVPNTSATAASSGSDLNGMAVKAACDSIRHRMAHFVATLHQTDPERVQFAEGRVTVGSAEYSFAEVARQAWMARISLSATGFYRTPDIHWDREAGRGHPFYYFAYGAAVAEVVVDRLTGEHRCLAAQILHDCGSSLNPALDLGQIEGGFVQGMGWLTTEELVWDGHGALRTHAPSTYKIPACSDRPRVFDVALWDRENPRPTIRRSKAVGEPPLMLANAVFLALSDAVAAFGNGTVYPALDAPATPERMLWAIERQL